MEDRSRRKSFPARFDQRDIELIVMTATLGVGLLTAMFLWSRRWVGAFQQTPSAGVLFASAVAFGGAALLLRIPIFRVSTLCRPSHYFLVFGTTAFVFLAAALMTNVRVQPWPSWLMLWVALLAVEVAVYWKLARTLRFDTQNSQSASVDELEDSSLPEGVYQRMIRSTDPELGEVIHGKWRARFRAGQRTETIHVSFCPPMASSPRLEVETISGPAAATKPSLVVPHGARIDVRLDEPADEETDVVLEFFAHPG